MEVLAALMGREEYRAGHLARSKDDLDRAIQEQTFALDNNAPISEIIRCHDNVVKCTEEVKSNVRVLRNTRIDLANYFKELSQYAGCEKDV